LFFVFAPEIVFIAFYGITLKKLLAMYKDSQETYSRKKLKQLLFSMLALPFLFTVSTYAVVTNINTPRAVQNEHSSQQTEKTNTEILQNRQLDVNTKNTKDQGVSLLETTKNRPDYCSEAPESVHLIKPTSTFSGPQLQFPAGFWAGVGGVQVSPENSWDGVATNTNDIYYSNSNLVNFSSSSYSKLHKNSLRNDTPNTEVGQKYDIWVSTIKHETIPTVINNHTKKPIENVQKYTFIDGIYYELYKNGVSLDYSTGGSFDVSSSTRADRQPCLTVTVRPSK
jgi:hypothetical protein